MAPIRVLGQFTFTGSVPENITSALVRSVEAVPESTFLDIGTPKGSELDVFDFQIRENLEHRIGWTVERNYRVVSEVGFNVDFACTEKNLLIEIEKGQSPRLELDLLKFAAAGRRREQWKYGALIVPASRVRLRLAGRRTPFEYLQRLSGLVGDVFEASIDGILVVGYDDPRG